MPHVVKRIARSTTAKLNNYAGPAGELFMDTATNDLVLQNGQAGGVRLAKAATAITADNGLSVTAGGTLAATTTVSGVDATTAAKGVVQLSSATNSASETTAATPKAVSDALQAAKDYADTAGAPYSGTAPIAVDATNRVISVTDATTSAKGVVQVGDNVTVTNGVVSVKPWAVHSATAAAVDVNDVQEGAIIQTDEPVGGDLTAVLAQVEQTLSGSSSLVPSSAAVKGAMESLLAPVYVNGTTGDDNNDGMTAATAVRTINQGLTLATNRGASNIESDAVNIYIAGGTYNETIQVRTRAVFRAQGTVRIVGHLGAAFNGTLVLGGDGDYEIIADNNPNVVLYVAAGGKLVIGAPVSVTIPAGQTTNNCIFASEGGIIYSTSHVTVAAPALTNGYVLHAYAAGGIFFIAPSSFTIDGATRAAYAIASTTGSSIVFHARVQALSINGTYTNEVAVASGDALLFIHKDITTVQGNASGVRYGAYGTGVIDVQGMGPYRIPGSQPGTVDATTYGVYA